MSTKKVLINKNASGFGLSKEAHELFLKKANIAFTKHTENFKTLFLKTSALSYVAAIVHAKDKEAIEEVKKEYIHHFSEIPRDHEALWLVADLIGMEAMNDTFSKLEFVEVPEDKQWSIKEIGGIEYITINPNPVLKFNETCSHWYASEFRPPWMDVKKDTVVVVGTDTNGVVHSTICIWGNVHHNFVDLVDYKWYPLTKLCPLYTENSRSMFDVSALHTVC
jgi:hypothetical protein